MYQFHTEPSKELRSMLRHLLEMMPASNVSGVGRDGAINLLVKQVPRKSLKNPDNSLTLWVIDQGKETHLHTILCYGGYKRAINFPLNIPVSVL